MHPSVLVVFLLLLKSTMTRATYKAFNLGFVVPKGSRTFMVGSKAAGRQAARLGAGAVAENLHLIQKHRVGEELTGNGMTF